MFYASVTFSVKPNPTTVGEVASSFFPVLSILPPYYHLCFVSLPEQVI